VLGDCLVVKILPESTMAIHNMLPVFWGRLGRLDALVLMMSKSQTGCKNRTPKDLALVAKSKRARILYRLLGPDPIRSPHRSFSASDSFCDLTKSCFARH